MAKPTISIAVNDVPLGRLLRAITELARLLQPQAEVAGVAIPLAAGGGGRGSAPDGDILAKIFGKGRSAATEAACDAPIKGGQRFVRVVTVVIEAENEDAADALVDDIEQNDVLEKHSHGKDGGVNARILGSRIDTFKELAEDGIVSDESALNAFDAREDDKQ